MLKVYTYAKCSTCRKAVKFLRDHQIKFEELPIRETPPSLVELKSMLEGRSVKALFNTSGLDYKALGLSAKLPGMSEAEALGLLTHRFSIWGSSDFRRWLPLDVQRPLRSTLITLDVPGTWPSPAFTPARPDEFTALLNELLSQLR